MRSCSCRRSFSSDGCPTASSDASSSCSGSAFAVGGLVLFAAAQSTAWLFGARAVQGIAVGMISGAATAALVELVDPDGDRRRAALLAGLAQALGSAVGPLLAGVLAEWAPAPRELPYLVMLGATLLAGVLVSRLPTDEAERDTWRIQRPTIPGDAKGAFARVSLTAGLVWATLALFLSIIPSYAGETLDTKNLAVLAAVAALALFASSGAQIVAPRFVPAGRRAQAIGLAVLAAGLAAAIAAGVSKSLSLLVIAAAAAGVGHGLAFIDAQQELNELAPAMRRGEVTSAFIACIYSVVAAAVIGTGALDEWLSLTLSFSVVAGMIAVLALATAACQLGVRDLARGMLLVRADLRAHARD